MNSVFNSLFLQHVLLYWKMYRCCGKLCIARKDGLHWQTYQNTSFLLLLWLWPHGLLWWPGSFEHTLQSLLMSNSKIHSVFISSAVALFTFGLSKEKRNEWRNGENIKSFLPTAGLGQTFESEKKLWIQCENNH